MSFVRRALVPARRLLLRGPHDDQLLAAPQEGAQLLRLGVRQRPRCRADHVGKVGQGAGVQRIRLGQLARGSRKIPGLPRIDDDHGQARRSQGARHRALQAAGGFQHDQGGVEGLEPVHERRDPAGIVGDGPALPGGAQGNIELGFGHINTHKALARHSYALLSARPCRYGLNGTRQLYGLWGVQDVTTHAPLRSRRTKAESVYHVRVLGDGDSPTSPLKDTRL